MTRTFVTRSTLCDNATLCNKSIVQVSAHYQSYETYLHVSRVIAGHFNVTSWRAEACGDTVASLTTKVRKISYVLRCGLTRVMTSKYFRFLHHTQERTTVGRTPLDEWSARRRDLYLTKNDYARGGIRTRNPSRRAAADTLHRRWRTE